MSLKERIVADLTAAMKAKDSDRTGALRMIKAAVLTVEKAKESGASATDDETTRVLASLVKQRKDSIEQYEKANRADLADKEKAELKFIEEYLPPAASREEIEKAVQEAVAETGAIDPKQMGAVMKLVGVKLHGQNADNKIVSEIVKAALNK